MNLTVSKQNLLVVALFAAAAAVALLWVQRAPAEAAEPVAARPPSGPEESVRRIRVKSGFELQLVAAEPLVQSPVALAYDENGNAYVAEMIDYPYTDATTHKAWQENTTDAPLGRVRKLIDVDGDGVFDESHVFAQSLSWPTGIACWKGGIYVTSTPTVWYLKDTDGDHVADEKREVFTGFRKFNVQAVINNPIWGLDNHITIAGSTNGGSIVSTRYADRPPVTVRRSDFRFDPRTELIEPISGGARFGNSFDDWGNRFIASPNSPGLHVVFDARVAARNRYLPMPNPVFAARHLDDLQPLFKISLPESWRAIRTEDRNMENPSLSAGERMAGGAITSASGITVYRGNAYPEEYHGQAFVAESANNLVHRMTLEPDGVTFRMRAADHDAEFVASPDNDFRPVNMINAPDGTLHIVDMQRDTIEHPWAIPEKILAQVDLLRGRDRGRIYRLAPPGFKAPPPPRLGAATIPELVQTLENPNAWSRETAQRLLVERQNPKAVAPVRDLLRHSRTAIARAHALWTLEGLGAIEEGDVLTALEDASAHVREQAVKVAGLHVHEMPALGSRVLLLANDDALRVRYQVAYVVGELRGDDAIAAALELLRRDGADDWIRAATLSAPPEMCLEVALHLLASGEWRADVMAEPVMTDLLFVLGAESDPLKLERIVSAFPSSPRFGTADVVLWESLGRGLKQAGYTLTSAFEAGSAGATAAQQVVSASLRIAADAGHAPEQRAASIQLLEYAEFSDVGKSLGALLTQDVPPSVQLAAMRILATYADSGVTDLLLRDWDKRTPQMRDDILAVLLSRQERVGAVLDAIENNAIDASQLSAVQRLQLLASADGETKRRAQQMLQGDAAEPVGGAGDKYAQTPALKGDPLRGAQVYQNLCAACHVFKGQGTHIGPNLETVRGWGVDQIILNIVDPNREVAPNYMMNVVELKDGTTASGMITEENSSSVRLKPIGAPEQTILRQNIAKMTTLPASLMPSGLDDAISAQDMADLVVYLQLP